MLTVSGCARKQAEKLDNAYCAYDDMISFIVQGYQSHWADGMTPETYGLSTEYLKESPHAGFCKTDLDGNGIIDLILGEQFSEGPTAIYDLMTIDPDTYELKHLEPTATDRRFAMDWFASYAREDRDQLWRDMSASIPDRVEDLMNRLTLDEKISLLVSTAFPIERLGIRKYYHGNEALHGTVRPGRFTVFPQAIGMAAMWDPELHHQIATAASDEARARWNELGEGDFQTAQFSDLLTFWSPTINIARDPRWGRTPETYGEDPFLTGVLGTAFVTGLQGDDPRYLKVVSTPKHFAANNEEHNRMVCNAVISEKQLREYYLSAYEMCVKEGKCQSVMASYNAINGMPNCCNKWLLTDVLRGDWGFEGYVVSDCAGVSALYEWHHYVPDKKVAATLAIKAGLDLECGDDAYMQPLKDAYDEGLVTDEDIDRATRRVLTSRMKLGLFDTNENNPYAHIDPQTVGCQKHQDLALKAARESIVLLKNDNGFLPLEENDISSIAVVGNNAANCELGDYSGIPTIQPISVLKALSDRLDGKVQINYVPWKAPNDETDFMEAKYFTDGIRAEYFDDMEFGKLRTVKQEPYVWYEPANKAPDPEIPDAFMSARWTGTFIPEVSGKYVFGLDITGSAKFSINGKLMFEGSDGCTIPVTLQAGKDYQITIEYVQVRDSAPLLTLKWSKPETGDITTDGVRPQYREAVAAAAKSDVVVAVMGINKNYEREGRDRDYLTLPGEQIEFLQNIYSVNKKVILVIVAGSSMAVTWENDHLPAIIDAWYGGEFGGKAIEEVIFGDYNPAGRLPLTFYKNMEQLPPFGDYDITKGRTYKYFTGEPLYPFGYGLSYTTFEYSALRVRNVREGVEVSFTVSNTGSRDGDEVAQVYVKLKDYEAENGIVPIKELKGFKRITLAKGEKQKIKIVIPREQLRYWSEKDHSFKITGETPDIYVGASSSDIRLSL